eukprot:6181418-Pleurochrysis_carterae.AAC.4
MADSMSVGKSSDAGVYGRTLGSTPFAKSIGGGSLVFDVPSGGKRVREARVERTVGGVPMQDK